MILRLKLIVFLLIEISVWLLGSKFVIFFIKIKERLKLVKMCVNEFNDVLRFNFYLELLF